MSFHNLGFVVPMPVLLELSIGACACACMCREGALDGLDFFLKKNTTKTKQTNGTFFVVYASSKLQSRSSRLKILLFFPCRKAALCGFSPFVAGPGTRKERLKEVKAVVLISYVYVLLMWEEDALLTLCLVNLPWR